MLVYTKARVKTLMHASNIACTGVKTQANRAICSLYSFQNIQRQFTIFTTAKHYDVIAEKR